jgi:hypothetical protein
MIDADRDARTLDLGLVGGDHAPSEVGDNGTTHVQA